MKILYTTIDFLCPDLARVLKIEGNDLVLAQKDSDPDILKGTLKRIPYAKRLDNLAQYDLVINDDNNNFDAVEARKLGVPAIGGDDKIKKMELDRKLASNIAKACGLLVPEVVEVKDLEDAKNIIKERGGKWVLKQQGKLDGVKGLNYVAKMENSEDVIAHIENLQEKWVSEVKQDFILQEKIEGYEMAIGSFWNSKTFQTDKDGNEVCEENWEHKSLFPGNLGQATGEQFTVQRVMKASDSKLFKETLDKIRPALLKTDFRGDFDINSIVTEKGAYFLEFTPRMGVPAQSGLMSIQKTKWSDFLLRVAKGEPTELEYDPRWCIVSWLYTSPFPAIHEEKETKGSVFEKITNNIANSKGIKVLFKEELTKEDWKNLHFDAVKFDGKDILVANSDGFILTACGLGETVDEAGDKVEKLLKKICVPKGFWRNDFHDTNYHHAKKDLIKWGYLEKELENKESELEAETLVSKLKDAILSKSKEKISKEQQKMIDGIKEEYNQKLESNKKEMGEELKKIKEAVKGIIYE